MYDTFYIVETSPQWYQLRLIDTHYCVGCGGSLDRHLKVIKKYVKKYKTSENVYRAVRNTEDGGRMGLATYEQYKGHYDSGLYRPYKDLIKAAVSQAKQEDKENSVFNRVKRRVRPVVETTIESLVSPSQVEQPEKVRTVSRIAPKKIKRTI